MKVITIPIEKNKEIGDLVKCENRYTIHNPNDMCKQGDVWQPNQLLILGDEIDVTDKKTPDLKEYESKIIASYPSLEGTEKISKETVEQWIQVGCPDEVEVETYPQIGSGYVDNGFRQTSNGCIICNFGSKEDSKKKPTENLAEQKADELIEMFAKLDFRLWHNENHKIAIRCAIKCCEGIIKELECAYNGEPITTNEHKLFWQEVLSILKSK